MATTRKKARLDTAQITLDHQTVHPGEAVELRVVGYTTPEGDAVPLGEDDQQFTIRWEAPAGGSFVDPAAERTTFVTNDLDPGVYDVQVLLTDAGGLEVVGTARVAVIDDDPRAAAPSGPIDVRLQRSLAGESPEETLWRVIDDRTDAIGWAAYADFMDAVTCRTDDAFAAKVRDGLDYRTRVDAYRFVRHATEEFLRYQCGLLPRADGNGDGGRSLDDGIWSPTAWVTGNQVSKLTTEDLLTLRDEYLTQLSPEDGGGRVLPYLRTIREGLREVAVKPPEALPNDSCYGLSGDALTRPCMLELIWSYWMEQGMLVQTMAALTTRFQNRAGARTPDPLANLELDPLRPANHLLWGYLQAEHERLSVGRRAYEYLHHYGLTLTGRAVPKLPPAETRSRFIEAFHTLLHVSSRFFREDDDNTVSADAFPVLNALQDLHLVLAEGAHNQYGDLPWTARVEMLTEQWMLARPEVREFLGHRAMVPYPEAWMPRVDAMRGLQGWGETSVRHFRELAVTGEKLLLSVRFGDWSGSSNIASAATWVRHWRDRIHAYVHAYRAVTGVDLKMDQIATRLADDLFKQPSAHIQKRRATAEAAR